MKITLPSGKQIYPPLDPYTWAQQSGTTYGWGLSSGILEDNVSMAVAFHRQRPFFQGITSVSTPLTTASWTPMPITEMIDTIAGHNDATNTSRWYAPVTINNTDWYLVIGYVPMVSSSTSAVHIAGVRVDGGTPLEGMKVTAGAHTTVTPMVVDLVNLTSDGTHYLELAGWQNTGGTINTQTSPKTPSLSVQWACSGSGTAVALPAVPHTWTDTDQVSASTTGGPWVPVHTHIRDVIRYLNFPPVARLTAIGSSQSISSGTGYTSIALTAADVDNYNGHNNSTNNSRYTFPRDGLYLVAGQYSCDETGGANTGYRSCRLLHTLLAGGSLAYYGDSTVPGSTTSTGTHVSAVALIRAVAGDYVEVQGQQSQGAARNVLTAAGNTSKMIVVWKSR